MDIPLLFIQGTKDVLAEFPSIESVIAQRSPIAALFSVADADHSFHVPTRSGQTDAQVLATILDETAEWMRSCSGTQ